LLSDKLIVKHVIRLRDYANSDVEAKLLAASLIKHTLLKD
jgi:hypothetical protein